MQSFITVEPSGELRLSGEWRIPHIAEIHGTLETLSIPALKGLVLDGSSLTALDSASALLLIRFLSRHGLSRDAVQWRNFSDKQLNILKLVEQAKVEDSPLNGEGAGRGLLGDIGYAAKEAFDKSVAVLSFIGEANVSLARLLFRPRMLRVRELVNQIELVFVDALPIVALVTALIGVVVAYLFATQIEKYGANIFIVDGVATAMWRELSPIIVAIIVAGRSGSAFTAQLGTMKLNEEIDALRTLGLSPMQVLVIPRLIALVIAMPLLVFVGDLVGVAASMVIAHFQLGISGYTFIQRMLAVMPPRTMVVGLIKAPVFAAFVALIGCRMGFAVENNAQSVGVNTTSTVVQSVVSVILLNAAFAVIFVNLKI